MDKMVTRTVKTTVIQAKSLKYENGTATATELEPLQVSNINIKNEEAARKLLTKEYGSQPFADIRLTVTEEVYGIPVDVFMANAQKIVRGAKQEDK